MVIAHDFMETYGGAERITAEIARAFPDAPVVAITGRQSVADRMGVGDRFSSLIPPRPFLLKHYRLLAPAFPALVDRLRVPDCDVIVSSSYAFAHRLRSADGARRICYSYGPLRFAWAMSEDYRDTWSRGPVTGAGFKLLAAGMRRSDYRSAQQVDQYLASSKWVAEQLERSYGRSSKTVWAPVDCQKFRPGTVPAEDFWLFCGRLVEPYKKVRILVEAFTRLGLPLVVAGDGPERAALEAMAGPNIEFAGMLEDDRLISMMQRCRAAIFPSRDDFGLIPVEIAACGRPVLAYAGGGALETVVPGLNGDHFPEQTASSLEAAVRAFDPTAYDPVAIREHALRWDTPKFLDHVVAAVREQLAART